MRTPKARPPAIVAVASPSLISRIDAAVERRLPREPGLSRAELVRRWVIERLELDEQNATASAS